MSSVLTPNIKNIIFDLGDVIIPINVSLTALAFSRLSGLTLEQVQILFREHQVFQQFETGLVDDKGFRDHIRQILANKEWADEVIDEAWNTLLLDLPIERIKRIQELKGRYRLFLLSNTSPIHIREVNQKLHQVAGVPTLNELFEKVYYSYEIRMMKPSPDIYQYVLDDAGLVAGETVFLDDNADNIRGAAELGIVAVQVQPPLTILDYLRDEPTNEDATIAG
ncbi:HAD family hydrolase [Tellurirhabdus rosea]|uniref:HAD family hydrolase n=1 Tax=Tellurirhabdus rosea TaxID=2674997 RepID=UPI002252C8DF|nr:HAD family phosphatase [Tellurirhabdus rosea]